MKFPKFCSVLVFTLGIAGGLTPTLGIASEDEKYEWKFFTYFVTNSTAAAINRAFAKDVTESSNGRLTIDVFTAGELPYKPTDVVKAVAANKIQMADAAVGFVAGDVPELNAFSLPFVCTSYDGFSRAIDSIGPVISKEMSDRFGVYTLMNWTMPPQNIWLVDPATGLDGLTGKKIRAWNPLQVEMLDQMGASAISMSGSEVPAALQRKVIEGAITSALSVADWKIFESLNGGLVTNFMMGHQFTLINEDALEELPADLQRLVIIKGREYQARFAAEMELADARAQNTLRENGMVLSQLSPADAQFAEQLTAPMADKWVEENGSVAADLLGRIRATCGV